MISSHLVPISGSLRLFRPLEFGLLPRFHRRPHEWLSSQFSSKESLTSESRW